MDFSNPESRIEAILQNMLGANNVLDPPESRIEYLLQQILENGGGGGGQSAIHVKGVTTTALTDGCDTNPITINGESYTAVDGDLVAYQSKEFLYNGSIWQELGDVSEVMAIIERILDDIADEFDATATYAVDDFVIKDGVLYKCTSAHTGAWDANDFTATTVVDEIASKPDALTAGKYIGIDDNNEISVEREIPDEAFTYTIQQTGDGIVKITKTVNGAVVFEETYDGQADVTLDALHYVYNNGVQSYTLLIASDTHDAGFKQTMSWWARETYTENFSTVDHSGEKLIIKSELDAEVEAIKDGTDINSFSDVETALADKQDKTDNSLQTTDKTVVGAVNELKSGLTNLSEEVNGDATVYPYADVITIPDAIPANLAECNVKIEPVQSGSGDPSPTNIRPISGHTEVDVQRDGKNWFRGHYEYNSTTEYSPLLPSTQYTISAKSDSSKQVNYQYIYKDNSFGGNARLIASGSTSGSVTVITPDNVKGINIYTVGISSASENIAYDGQAELGSSATDYEPYHGKTYTIALGSTIYGGTVDFDSGVMTVDREIVVLDGTNNAVSGASASQSDPNLVQAEWTGYRSIGVENATFIADKLETVAQSDRKPHSIYSSTSAVRMYIGFLASEASTNEECNTWLSNNNVTVCCPLATPTTIQLTPQQIQLLKGTNTIYASTGQISVTVNGVSGAIGQVQEQVNDTDAALADIVEKLPTAPTTDGAYVLTVTVADGTPTYSWVSGS